MLLGLTSLTPHTAPRTASDNPFAPFFGTRALQNDQFQQVWDGQTVETLTIPNHITVCEPINTAQRVLCVVDAGDLKGHILWSLNTDTQQVHHLSHFGAARSGVGTGRLSTAGDLTTQVRFQGEPEGSYRIYAYEWLSADVYTMHSAQYDSTGQATGNGYGGTFVRVSAQPYR